MGIKYKNIRDILKKEKIDFPQFGFFNQRGNVIKIAQWQPYGEINFTDEKGFWAKDEKHKDNIGFLYWG